MNFEPSQLPALQRYGRGLQQFSVQLEQEKGRNEANTTMLQVPTFFLRSFLLRDGLTFFVMQEAFSLLAYADPWNSPVGNQLEPAGREPVCAALNSAILGIHLLSMLPLTDSFEPESKNLPGRPPLEISLAHSAHLLKLMSHR